MCWKTRYLPVVWFLLVGVSACGGGGSSAPQAAPPAPAATLPPPPVAGDMVWDQGNWDEVTWQ